jgi:hypothetical protein
MKKASASQVPSTSVNSNNPEVVNKLKAINNSASSKPTGATNPTTSRLQMASQTAASKLQMKKNSLVESKGAISVKVANPNSDGQIQPISVKTEVKKINNNEIQLSAKKPLANNAQAKLVQTPVKKLKTASNVVDSEKMGNYFFIIFAPLFKT